MQCFTLGSFRSADVTLLLNLLFKQQQPWGGGWVGVHRIRTVRLHLNVGLIQPAAGSHERLSLNIWGGCHSVWLYLQNLCVLNDFILTLRCSGLINPSCGASGSTSDALLRHSPVPNHENGGSDEEPDKSLFLETLLNHHNPPLVFMVQVLLVSPRQLPPWQPPAMEPHLFQGRCPSETLAQLWGAFKAFEAQGEYCALK